jgi:hypothetical protein
MLGCVIKGDFVVCLCDAASVVFILTVFLESGSLHILASLGSSLPFEDSGKGILPAIQIF